MPRGIRTRNIVKYLDDGFIMYKILHTLLSQVVGFTVVLIKEDDQGVKEGITRFDTAHDCVHRDVLCRSRPDAVIDKIWYPDLSYKDGYNFADKDFSEHYNEYYQVYETQ